MNIGIDIDETITDSKEFFIQTSLKFINKYKLNKNYINDNTNLIAQMYDWTDEEIQKLLDENLEYLILNSPIKKEAVQILTKIKELGHKIFLISARSLPDLMVEELTKKWLNKNKVPYDKLFVKCKNKGEICVQNNIELMLDDFPENIISCINAGVKSYMIDSYYNSQLGLNLPRVKNLQEFYEIVKKLS